MGERETERERRERECDIVCLFEEGDMAPFSLRDTFCFIIIILFTVNYISFYGGRKETLKFDSRGVFIF